MKVSDYIANFLADQGVTHVFGMSGGAALHLWDSVAAHTKLTPVFTTHEQCAAMAADGYARVSGKLGVAMATSGPGATNLLTGCACSYYDSIPTLMITGQVATHRSSLGSELRQFGFQETQTTEIFRSVTKAVYDVRRPEDIAVLHAASAEAFADRPGPVLIDIPDDIQRAEIPDVIFHNSNFPVSMAPLDPQYGMPSDPDIAEFHRLLRKSERPVLILGGGLKTPRVQRLEPFIHRLGVPVLTTWAGCDLLPWGSYLNLGTFGNYGPRFGNMVIQNADLVICLGSRLSSNLTSAKLDSFAPHATIVMVDADRAELDKFDGRGINVTLRIHARLQQFIDSAMAWRTEIDIKSWLHQIFRWRSDFPAERNAPCQFFHDLELAPDEIVFADTGANLTWACNHLRLGPANQLHSAWNFTPMGYALPAAIGAAKAAPGRTVTCIIGDGGLMLCLGELATLRRSDLPIRIILVENGGHTIQKQTIETWLGSRYVGVDWKTGLAFADWEETKEMFDIPSFPARNPSPRQRPYIDLLRVNPDDRLHPYLRYGSSLTEQLPAKEAAE